ncbi:winged helix-turn-helix domain-containing protein [Candidatus Bathyarchaeota archaeon]|nr:winged helix-turn-helix domain-containing protein [Candidatus Bathyarchaeota archaeon]
MIKTILSSEKNEQKTELAQMLRELNRECQECAPLTPIKCISRCKTWKLKNELRKLTAKMNDPKYMKKLFNVLKNETRLHILNTSVKRRYSLDQIQQELRRVGHNHSRETLNQEYLKPLLGVGLISEIQDKYYATMLGDKITTILTNFPDFGIVLPAHSECYEEKLLRKLLDGPKTFHEIEKLLTPTIASRILKRLKGGKLVITPEEREYVFFFRTKRDPNKEILNSIEQSVYQSIPSMGFPVKKIAKKAQLSVRRVYKYLRGLKGKKLVFTRKTPKKYELTSEGKKLASIIKNLTDLVKNTWDSSIEIINNENS